MSILHWILKTWKISMTSELNDMTKKNSSVSIMKNETVEDMINSEKKEGTFLTKDKVDTTDNNTPIRETETTDNERYFEDKKIIQTDEETVLYVRKKGKSHIRDHKPCQDYCMYTHLDKNVSLLMVADGLGSQEYSDSGSKFAYTALYETVNNTLSQQKTDTDITFSLTNSNFKKQLIDKWTELCVSDYNTNKKSVETKVTDIKRKYATTLLYVIITQNKFVLGQIGDGAILLYDDENCSMKFRHTWPKYDTQTDSLSSLMATSQEYYTVALNRESFNNILLSTDGIYDRLDKEDYFTKYARNLKARCLQGDIENPFYFDQNNIDISAYTFDDCSVVLYYTSKSESAELSSEIECLEKHFGNNTVSFVRLNDTVRIYSGEHDGENYEIHCYPNIRYSHGFSTSLQNVYSTFSEWVKLFDSIPNHPDKVRERKIATILFGERGKCFFVYFSDKNYHSFEYLSHIGALRDKKWNYNDLHSDDDCSVTSVYNGLFGLIVAQNYHELIISINKAKLLPTPAFYETLMADVAGNILFCPITLKSLAAADDIDKKASEISHKKLSQEFNLLGFFEVANRLLPVYRIPMTVKNYIHPGHEREKMFLLLYKEAEDVYGIHNVSSITWEVKTPGNKNAVINPNETVTLQDGLEILIPDGNKYITYTYSDYQKER